MDKPDARPGVNLLIVKTKQKKGRMLFSAKKWTQEELVLLGSASDRAVAQIIGSAHKTVTKEREKRGIPKYRYTREIDAKPFEKKCSKCLSVKPSTEFVRNSQTPSGLKSYCKECRKSQRRIKPIDFGTAYTRKNTGSGYFSLIPSTESPSKFVSLAKKSINRIKKSNEFKIPNDSRMVIPYQNMDPKTYELLSGRARRLGFTLKTCPTELLEIYGVCADLKKVLIKKLKK